MLVAGEASGDALGAGLVRALRRRLGDGAGFVGVGGPKMADAGIVSPFDIAELSIVGLAEILWAAPRLLRRVREVVRLALEERPDIVVLIDSWGFTIRVAEALRRATPVLPLVKYVGPQVWAMRPGRARSLARTVDRLLTIHSFDAPLFEAQGLATTFVGNPVLSWDTSGADPSRLRRAIGAGRGDGVLLILPGSRPREIERMLGPFEAATSILKAERPKLRLVMAAADTVAAQVKARVAGWRHAVHVVEGEADKLDAMSAATAALACSGTVTTELAMAGCPMVISYRLDHLTHFVARFLIRTPYIALINIAAGSSVAPELVQQQCTGVQLAAALAPLLDDPVRRAAQIAAQGLAVAKLGRGGPDPSERAADAVLEVLEASRAKRAGARAPRREPGRPQLDPR
ncbi:MAG TPA: lipid-A-disaccharide synthase [Caulobacteraceae bacterium]|nr:lipid-A-disaccharide synthase [Caulobacteraceae bacterium]